MVSSSVRPVLDFQGAVRVLATRPGSVADRLTQAYSEYLRGAAFARLSAPYREQCEAVRDELKAFVDSPGARDEQRATELAAKVLLTYDALIKNFFA